MLSLVVALVILAPELPPECQAPPTREVSVLTGFAQSSGSLSVGLDSVATWCFDSGGTWTGGRTPPKGKQLTNVEPVGDCAKALLSCEAARASMSVDTRTVLYEALKDLERPFLGVKYKPKRSGLAERPPEVADCSARDRSTLFGHAQARMDLARLASQVQNEYANYKTWLFAEGLKCGQAMARGEKDYLRRGIAIDTPTQSGGTQQVPGGTNPTGTGANPNGTSGTANPNGTSGTVSTANPDGTSGGGTAGTANPNGTSANPKGTVTGSGSTVLPEQSRGATGTQTTGNPTSTATGNPTSTATGNPTLASAGNTNSTGARNPTGTPTSNPQGNALTPTLSPTGDRGTLGLGGPTAEREKALSSSLLDKWRYFLFEQGKIEGDVDWVAGFLASRELRECRCVRPIPGEMVRRLENKDRLPQLEADDEKNARCELCLLDSFPKWKVRSQKQCSLALELTEYELGVLQRSDDGNGFPPRCADAAKLKQTGAAPQPNTVAVTGSPTQTKPKNNSNAYIITKSPDPIADMSDYLKPSDYAPIPQREEGRMYVRVFTSSACIAEVLPGPVQARTGDLLPLPPSAREITVRGACGGFAEIYFGREEKPRVAESFARGQPLRLKFGAP